MKVLQKPAYSLSKEEQLIQACQHNNKDEIKRLLSYNLNINAEDHEGNTALHWSVMAGSIEIIILLLVNGADINVLNKMAQTPLYWAVVKGDKKVVELLLDKGADILIRDKSGATTLEIAKKEGYKEIEALLELRQTLLNYQQAQKEPVGIITNDQELEDRNLAEILQQALLEKEDYITPNNLSSYMNPLIFSPVSIAEFIPAEDNNAEKNSIFIQTDYHKSYPEQRNAYAVEDKPMQPFSKLPNEEETLSCLSVPQDVFYLAEQWKKAEHDKDIKKQLSFIMSMAESYLHQGKHIYATALYNYGINLCYYSITQVEKKSQESEDFFKEQISLFQQWLATVEKDYIQNLNKDPKRNPIPYPEASQQYKQYLTEIRNDSQSVLSCLDKENAPWEEGITEEEKEQRYQRRAQIIRELCETNAEKIKHLVRTMVADCQAVLGTSPCEYAIIGLGSLARKEITPYSDLEFAILVEDESHTQYFYDLTMLLYLKVINIGETILPSVAIPALNDFYTNDPAKNWFFDTITLRGFSFDGQMPWACKTPFGRKATDAKPWETLLIRTPSNMANYLKDESEIKEGYHLESVLDTITLIDGSQQLFSEYKRFAWDILNQPILKVEKQHLLYGATLSEECTPSFTTLARVRALKVLAKATEEFKPYMEYTDAGRLFEVKKEIYRLPSLLIGGLALYYTIMANGTWEHVEGLDEKEIISKEASNNLKVIASIATELRLRTYLHHRSQREKLDAKSWQGLSIDENNLRTLFSLKNIDMLVRYYETVLPLHNTIKKLCQKWPLNEKIKHEMHELLSSSNFRDTGPFTKGLVYDRLLQLDKARQCYEIALSEYGTRYGNVARSETVLVLNNLGTTWTELGEDTKSLPYYTQALQMLEALYGAQPHPDIAYTLNNIGRAWHNVGEMRKAIDHYERALQIYAAIPNMISGISMISILNNLANTWCALGATKKAIHYLEEALNITKTMYGEKLNINIALTLGNLGMVWQEQGEATEFLSYTKQSLQILRILHGEGPHPSTAKTLNNMGIGLYSLGKPKEGLLYLEQALTIYELIYKQLPHPDKAMCLNNLGEIWRTLGDLTKALHYFEQSLEMRCEIHGKVSHPETATVLNNIGIILHKCGKLKEAENYYKQSLQMKYAIYNGSLHPAIARTLGNLGGLCRERGDYRQAVTYDQDSYQIFLQVYGDTHPLTQQANQLLQTSQKLIKLSGVLQQNLLLSNLGEAVEICEVFISHSRYSVSFHQNLACLYHAQAQKLQQANTTIYQEKLNQAEAMFQQALKIEQQSEVLVEYAHFLYKHHRYQEAISLLGKALDIFTQEPSDNIHTLAYSMIEYNNVVPALQRFMITNDDINIKTNYLAHYLLVIACHAVGQQQKAEQVLQDFRIIIGTEQDELLTYLVADATACIRKTEHFQVPLVPTKASLSQAAMLMQEGTKLYRSKNYREAIINWKRALEQFQQCSPQQPSEHIATALHNLGSAYRDLEDYRHAIEYYQTASQVKQALPQQDPVSIQKTADQLVLCQRNQQKALIAAYLKGHYVRCISPLESRLQIRRETIQNLLQQEASQNISGEVSELLTQNRLHEAMQLLHNRPIKDMPFTERIVKPDGTTEKKHTGRVIRY